MDNLTVGSMFAGVGGICLGFKRAGFDIQWANEIDSKACETYRHNFSEINLIEADVCSLNTDESMKVDVLTSGFPCQAFSIAGKKQGFKDERGNLFIETARFIEDLQPQAYMLENVPNFARHDKGKTLETVRSILTEDLGYSFTCFELDAPTCGVPQSRNRFFMVGFKDHSIEFDKSFPPWAGNFGIQSWLMPETVLDKYYYREGSKIYPQLKEAVTKKMTVYQYRRTYVRENKSYLCPTLTANMGTGGHNVPIVLTDEGIRKLTPRECFNFQGFPYDYELPAHIADCHLYKQAGNSVCVPAIYRIASEIKTALARI